MKYYFFILFFCVVISSPGIAETQFISCPSEPPSVRRLQLKERWRVDVDSPEAPVLGFTYESQVFAHNGRIYLLDGQLCQVHIYSHDGVYLGKILGEGEGPGEVRNPGAMFLCSDGRIAVQHGYPSKLEFLDLSGNPMGRWRLQANAWANQLQETPEGWFGVYSESKQSEEPGVFLSEMHVALHDNEGVRTQEFYTAQRKRYHNDGGSSDEADDFVPWYSAVAVEGGQVVYAAQRDKYRLEWKTLSGEVTRVVTRDFRAHKRSREELNSLKYRSYSISNDDIIFADRKFCEFDPMIRSIDPLADGSLRIRTSLYETELLANMVCRFEIHESSGALRERVEIYDPTGEYDVDYDIIALLDEGSAMVLRNVRPASRVANDARLHPELQKKLPPIPDERDDVTFVPVVYDLVPYSDSSVTR